MLWLSSLLRLVLAAVLAGAMSSYPAGAMEGTCRAVSDTLHASATGSAAVKPMAAAQSAIAQPTGRLTQDGRAMPGQCGSPHCEATGSCGAVALLGQIPTILAVAEIGPKVEGSDRVAIGIGPELPQEPPRPVG